VLEEKKKKKTLQEDILKGLLSGHKKGKRILRKALGID